MQSRLILSAVAVLAACATPPAATPVTSPPTRRPPSTTTVVTTRPVPPVAAPSPHPTLPQAPVGGEQLAVPPVPADLIAPTAAAGAAAPLTAPAPGHDGDDHDDHDHDGPVTPGAAASSWVVARTLSRGDDPPGARIHQLTALAANPTVAATADQTSPSAPAGSAEAQWAIVTTVTDLGDGWWRVTYLIKRTRPGQTGTATGDATIDVHVTADGLVDGERT